MSDELGLDVQWYRRCANEPDLCDHLGLRNALSGVLDAYQHTETRLAEAERLCERSLKWGVNLDSPRPRAYARCTRALEQRRVKLYCPNCVQWFHVDDDAVHQRSDGHYHEKVHLRGARTGHSLCGPMQREEADGA